MYTTIITLRFRTHQLRQTDLLKEQSNQGLHCLQFSLHFLNVASLYGKTSKCDYSIDLECGNFVIPMGSAVDFLLRPLFFLYHVNSSSPAPIV